MSAAAVTFGLLSLVSSAVAHPGVGRRHPHPAAMDSGYNYASEGNAYSSLSLKMPIPSGALSSASAAMATSESSKPYGMGNATAQAVPGSGNPYSATQSYSLAQSSALAQAASSAGGTCGPATVTVTATNKVTVTVNPGGASATAAGATSLPSSSPSSAASVSAAAFSGYGSQSSTAPKPAATSAASSSVSAAAAKSSSPSSAAAAATTAKSSAVSSAASSTSASASPKVSASSSSGRKGMGYSDGSLLSACGASSGDWIFNWGFEEGNVNVQGVEYIPMLKDLTTSSDTWSKFVSGSSASHFQLFNECDKDDQCHKPASTIAQQWDSYASPVKAKGGKIIGPSVSNSNIAGQSLDWFKDFRGNYTGWNEICSVHFYWDPTPDAASTLETWLNTEVKPLCPNGVYIPEFGLNSGDDATRAKFIADATNCMDKMDFVLGYAPLYCANGYLLTNGQPNGQTAAYSAVSS